MQLPIFIVVVQAGSCHNNPVRKGEQRDFASWYDFSAARLSRI